MSPKIFKQQFLTALPLAPIAASIFAGAGCLKYDPENLQEGAAAT